MKQVGHFAVAAVLAAAFHAFGGNSRIDVHPQSFDAGGWGLDVQFMDTVGSPYLIAHGRGIRVVDAVAKVSVPKSGKWNVWVRSRKWVDGAGRFRVTVGGKDAGRVFGASQSEWAWERGGKVELAAGETEVRLVDLDGFDGRMAGVALSMGDDAPEGPLSLADGKIDEAVEADFVVVGGGLPGTCAAVAAARRGLRVALVNDRPVLGGNASSEIRVWSGGEARYPLVKELRGWFMNRDRNLELSDANRMRIVADEKTLSAHLCTRAFAAETKNGRIVSVKALDWKRNRTVEFRAPVFCDATGDGWVGYWAGADWKMGREAKSEYGESCAPDKADGDTLGATLMWTSAEANTDIPFSAPWAEKWACGEVAVNGEWNWEYGIHHDMVKDGEWIRDRLLLAIYGAFSLAKRNPENSRRVLDFLPFILGRRESRRLMGDWVFSENDVSQKPQFEDAIASGSWSVDLHYDDAKEGVDFLTTARQPHYGRYWIPYRSIYSRNIANLFMAGRCFSCTHVGLGSPRVINTLSQLGVAAGEAAALCRELKCDPRGIYEGGHFRRLQRLLGGDFPGNPDPDKADWRIVDETGNGVVLNGKWRYRYCQNGEQEGDGCHMATDGSKTAVYPLQVEKAGRYRIYGKAPYFWKVTRPSSTALAVESEGKKTDLKWDQTQRMGEWNDLGVFDLAPGAKLVLDPEKSEGMVIADGFAVVPADAQRAGALGELMPVPVKVEAAGGMACSSVTGNVSVTVAPVPGARKETADEAYVLEVAKDGVKITAPTKRGELWARVTLEQLVRLSGGKTLPCCRIEDWPRFKWRGFMHDSGRNYLEVEHVKGIIDAMSRCKMNLFHWHFTEYYGWRLESKKYPELQKDSSFYIRYIGKYYTQEEFKDVVAYAAKKGVTVMPEFDIPGHALAFRRAFGFKTMRDEGVREKLCDLVDELCTLASKEDMPFIHIGSDEARLPEEKVPPKWLAPIVDRVHANGRTVVGWTPGELAGLTERGSIVGMRWGTPKDPGAVGKIPFFDATGMYLDALDPFEIPSVATYRRICPWDESEGERLGAITCAWHDDFSGTGVRTIGNQTVIPALVLFGDSYWRGRDGEPAGNNGRIMPRGGDPDLAKAADIERRTAAQRDKVWYDCPYPFQFLKQSDMRWRVSLSDGTLLATNVAQATMFLWQRATQGTEGETAGSTSGNLTTNKTGTAILETWIKAPEAVDCGAWIGFTDYTRDHGRAYSAPTPSLGQWSRYDATVEINGKKVAPPKWKKPGQQAGPDVEHLLYVHQLDEIAFEDEEYYMREPTPIRLEKGWNHVKLTVPMKTKARNHAPWVGTFIPLLGTTERPREVPGLEYSSSPKK